MTSIVSNPFFNFDNYRAFNGLRQKHRTPNPKSPTDVCRRFSASKRRLSTSDNDVDLRSPSRSGSSRCQVRIVSSGDPLTMIQIFRLILVTCQAKDSMVIGKTTFEISPTNFSVTTKHRGIIFASHPAVLGSIRGIPKNLFFDVVEPI